ncbi:MAG: hypothetical protein LBS08_04780 [Candidatus Symbiothrix sp.]|jgi:hypothetical protein|nr:hypothetical protein [Candidatus Symbiothrix sp.]
MNTATHSKIKKRHEKYRNIILGIAFLLIVVLTVGIFTFRNYPNDKENMVFLVNSEYTDNTTNPQKPKVKPFQSPKITDTVETEAIYIPQTRSLLFHTQNSVLDRIPAGMIYYEGKNGKLESSINRNETGIHEELTSYDEKGNFVDKLEIGYICDSVRHLKCAVIFKNKISIYEMKLSADNKNEEVISEYLISPQMKFSKRKTYKKL